MNCAAAFASKGCGAGSQISYCPSSGLGEGMVCLVWEAPDTSVLTEALRRLGPAGLRGPSCRTGGESSFISLLAQGCPWTESGGRRRREAGLCRQRPLTCFYRPSARGPQVTPDTVGVREPTVRGQTDEKGGSSPPLYEKAEMRQRNVLQSPGIYNLLYIIVCPPRGVFVSACTK